MIKDEETACQQYTLWVHIRVINSKSELDLRNNLEKRTMNWINERI